MHGKEIYILNSGEIMNIMVRAQAASFTGVSSHECCLGKFVRYGPNRISVNSNIALSEIYGCKANVKKSRFYKMYNIAKDISNTHSCIDRALHARKRRVLAQGLSTLALKAMEDRVTSHIRNFCRQIGNSTEDSVQHAIGTKAGQQWSPARNMAEWCSYLGYDAMGEMAFGKSFGMLNSTENRFVINIIADSDRENYTVR